MDRFAAGCTYLRESLQKLLTWVVRKNWPYTIIDDAEFCDILVMLHGSVNIPSANTLAGDIQMAHEMSKAKLIQVLEVFTCIEQAHTGKVHMACNVWTSCKASSYLSLILQWCPEHTDEVIHLILDFLRVSKRHTGVNLACDPSPGGFPNRTEAPGARW
ncbi:hypothetical protein K439DRAFT_1614938 [Ramaria rubella]|nr:hypothetical protein K439DRAFT_1614938 [Ramaria rubella]